MLYIVLCCQERKIDVLKGAWLIENQMSRDLTRKDEICCGTEAHTVHCTVAKIAVFGYN